MTIRAAEESDKERLLAIWLASVRATHTFLSEQDVQTLYPLVRDQALPALELWVLIEDQAIIGFAGLSGDINPVHLDDDFAAGTIFKKRIAHGFLTGSLFSTALGTKLPGPGCIYLSQGLKFRAPVYIGDEVVATVRITAIDPEKARVTLACDASVNGKTVLPAGSAKR